MSFVFENCRPVPISEIRKIMLDDLGQNVLDLFIHIEAIPIACATIAQVHVATMYGCEKSVVIKVQRPTSKTLMTLDMKNMILVSRVMEILGIHLPFDHISVLLEYQNQVRTN
jgi:ubiquinone biosynthesis protein